MKSTLFAMLALGLMCCFPLPGFSKSFDGIVTEVLNGGSGLRATVTDDYGTTKKDVMFHLLPDVDLSEYKSMDKIKPGNRVRIEAEKQDNNWKISKLEPYLTS